MSAVLNELLACSPYELSQAEKERVFMPALREAALWHYQASPEFKKICQGKNFDPAQEFEIIDLPYIPVPIFKKFDLRSVPDLEIIKTLYSSGTSGNPSKVFIDQATADAQGKALTKILTSFLGKERRHFLIFDSPNSVSSRSGELSSRGTAIRGILTMAKRFTFLLDDELKLDQEKLEKTLNELNPEKPVCFFGFTWLIYNVYLQYGKQLAEALSKVKNSDTVILHIGGWKKLQDRAVSKAQFNQDLSTTFALPKSSVIDFYGMTEQLGTVYPDCSAGHKHAPAYAEIIIRNPETLLTQPNNQLGFIQLVSPIPHSYPGISILSEDMGILLGTDDCPCGRKGKYFEFKKRSEGAEVKGCGDALDL